MNTNKKTDFLNNHQTGTNWMDSCLRRNDIKTYNKLIVTIVSLILLLASIIHPASVSAAESTITAIPPRLILSGKPGETITARLKVINGSDTSQNFSVSVQDFIVLDKQGTPIPVSTSVSNRWSLKSWVQAPEIIPIDSRSTQIVNISIKVPMTALPGGHYAMITYMPNGEIKPGELKKTASIIGQRVGSLIFFTVSGPISESINITRFSIPKFSEHGPINMEGTLESLSDVHVSPLGSITIFNPLNTKVVEIPVEFGNIFPETARDFAAAWDQKWGWGKYRADLNLTYGQTGALATATVFFWLFPIRLVIYTLITAISLLIIIILLSKRSKKHQEALEKEVAKLKEELKARQQE